MGEEISGPGPKGENSYRIVGIVGSAKDRSLLEAPKPTIYYPSLQASSPYMTLVLRTTSDPLNQTPQVRAIVTELDRDIPVYKVATMEQLLADSLARRRFSTVLLGVLASF